MMSEICINAVVVKCIYMSNNEVILDGLEYGMQHNGLS